MKSSLFFENVAMMTVTFALCKVTLYKTAWKED